MHDREQHAAPAFNGGLMPAAGQRTVPLHGSSHSTSRLLAGSVLRTWLKIDLDR
ncbi:hypothetical protein CBOM_03159 [Ceraceosorus bombacis]|uniref:Uncharacterized protein n=1 Tax=Ceraceosorus bombacis TaxID=401625 RepID=A0A0P1BKL8_9BASI|nr:hypothetical protein CBOM_03159 [Ceraceosorus bombacis]